MATTSLTFEPGFDVRLGQGADSDGYDGPASVTLLAHGCVTGDVGMGAGGGVTTAGGGTATLGSVSSGWTPIASWFLPKGALDTFGELVHAAPERSLAGKAEAA